MNDVSLTKTEMLMNSLRDRIASRALGPGDRMPSIRRFARTMGVSPSTVVEAYDRLAAEGIIHARRGSGFYVTGRNLPPMKVAEMGATRPRNVDPFWVSRQSLDPRPGALQPGCGWLPENWMPHNELRKGLRALAKSGEAVLTNYAGAHGSLALRQYLLGRFAEENLPAAPEQVMLTASASQAMDLICRLLLQPGDTVLVDDPGYFNFHALLQAHRVRLVGVPYTPDGPDLDAFEVILTDNTARLYLTNSALHNPTGATISPQVAYRLLTLAGAHDLTIVEDDTFADLEPDPSPRLAVLDGLNRVLKIGGFSKTLSASIRCGYIAGGADWIDALVDLQVATSFGGPSPVAAELLAGVLSGGSYRKHLVEIRGRLSSARKSAAARLAPLGITPWTQPRGGFYLWCRFPEGIDTGEVAKHCAQENVILAPGNVFSPSQSAASFMRFNVAQMADKRVLHVLENAMAAR
ncbi:PLP-dependent aminotransferase family protein [Roseibium salinum]|uniref:PLP-dependent aminotransferase family protein n=1 Tax=Roseibium salinum TaxID=1604349 RepID=A0ABT3QXA2_9HYPH|nr:PLP-dependent aminotransferase family protein [Roseibium sp. DSM 29163]MCX2721575.1 PLP-dependent aminotransferase family protein [Roseibium sp. DSM 29163]